MKKNTIITFGVVIIFLLTSVSAVAIDNTQQSGESEPIIIKNNDNIDRWAVIIGISEYADFLDELPVEFAQNAMDLYALLQDKDSRWNADNMLLLLDDEATKQNILNALDWLKENADEGDIVLFSYSGHGNRVPDKFPFDELDLKDECLYPYESDLASVIIDDVLGSKFDEISNKGVKGMFLIFNSCLSGGLVNWNDPIGTINSIGSLPVQETIDVSNIDATGTLSTEESLTNEQILNIFNQLPEESNIVTTESGEIPSIEEIIEEWNAAVQDANNFTAGLTEDISTNNKVVLTASLPHSLGHFVWTNPDTQIITLQTGILKAIEKGKSTAEDISQYTKSWWLSNPYVILSVFLLNFRPFYLLFQLFNNLIFPGGWVWMYLPIPMYEDGYPVNDPSSAKLSIIGDGGGNSQSTAIQSNPISQPSTQPSGITTQQSASTSTTTSSTSTTTTTTTTVTSTAPIIKSTTR